MTLDFLSYGLGSILGTIKRSYQSQHFEFYIKLKMIIRSNIVTKQFEEYIKHFKEVFENVYRFKEHNARLRDW